MTTCEVRAAGGVLWRPGRDGDVEVALVHRPKYDDWTLPKGKLDAGEGWLDAAVREVAEETGHSVEVGDALGDITYRVAGGDKRVRYWAMRAAGGAFTPTSEVDALRWLPASQARWALTYDRDREVLNRFVTRDGTPR